MSYSADPGETNNVTVTNGANGALVINDTTANIEADSDACTISADGHTATCTPAEPLAPQLDVSLRDGDDTFVDNAVIPSEKDVTQCFFSSCTADTPSETFDVISTVEVDGGDGNDNVTGNDNSEEIFPGFGNDTVHAGGGADDIEDVDQSSQAPADRDPDGGNDHFFGGAGQDYLSGGDGDDELRGEDGDDFIEGGLGTDTIDGGNGFDGVGYFSIFRYKDDGTRITVKPTDPGATVVLDANAATTGNGIDGENDSLVAIEDVDGSFASDTITGSSVSNALFGNDGNDTITGGAGNDNLSGGGGDDTVNAQDGEIDAVDCGGGINTDKANVDNIDVVRDCDTATLATAVVPPVTPQVVVIPNPTDVTKAKISQLKAAKKVKAKTFRKKGKYSFTITADENVKLESSLESKAGKKALRSTIGYVNLAGKNKTLAATKKTKITLTVKKALRKKLKKHKKMRLTIRLTDAGGNLTTKKVTIKLT